MVQFQFFRFSRQNLGGRNIFEAKFLDILKKILKNGFARTCWILKGTKSWKMSPFHASAKNPREKNHRGGTLCPPCSFSLMDFWWMRQMGSFFLTLFLSIFDRSWQIYFLEFFFKISRNLASKTFCPPKFWRENRKNWNLPIFSPINHTFSCWI